MIENDTDLDKVGIESHVNCPICGIRVGIKISKEYPGHYEYNPLLSELENNLRFYLFHLGMTAYKHGHKNGNKPCFGSAIGFIKIIEGYSYKHLSNPELELYIGDDYAKHCKQRYIPEWLIRDYPVDEAVRIVSEYLSKK